MSSGLYQAFIYLLAAIVAVPLAKRLGLGSVIGYLPLGSALDLRIDVLRELGMDERRAHRVVEIFRENDEASVREMAKLGDDVEDYVSVARKPIENLERALQSDVEMRPDSTAESGISA